MYNAKPVISDYFHTEVVLYTPPMQSTILYTLRLAIYGKHIFVLLQIGCPLSMVRLY